MEHIHQYKLISENKDGRVEICVECKKRLTTKKDSRNGRIDNKVYLKEHSRDLAQPTGRTSKLFSKIYGEEAGYISRYKK